MNKISAFCLPKVLILLANDVFQPHWVLKTAKEKHAQRLVQMSADLARQVGVMLEDFQNGIAGQVPYQHIQSFNGFSIGSFGFDELHVYHL